ncbi:Short-chain dehydrogenase/reductase SDR [Cordyceps militaris CM01]|uniref:Short-chain dehydrogenase/reductase SDR n=1 Tax=Cordyceps militaris (strain CM01) TaxID=983644 RepID=G3JPF1_CORMM|nr:Short-chain dehydrogenase/reductase SDR [Cordyceps militaris CM01]EGX89761.1 Short-chain dehydrogenase/reductase SDR [Cordyceps militaris CM01]
MASPTIVLITGASRGIGRGIFELYVAKPNHTVIAANRNPDDGPSQELLKLPTAAGTTVQLVKVDATNDTDALKAAETLKSRGINHVDIVIANAGKATAWPKLEDAKIADIQDHIDTNVYGFVRLYQAFLPFLKASKDPKLVVIGSSAAFLTASIQYPSHRISMLTLHSENAIPFPNAVYGPTKILHHWYARTIAIAETWLTAFPIDPGFVQTEMGNRGARAFDLEQASITVDESVQGVVKVIDAATKETHSGKLWLWTGQQEPW